MAVATYTLQQLLENRNQASDACRAITEEVKTRGDGWNQADRDKMDRARDDFLAKKKEYDDAVADRNREEFADSLKNLDKERPQRRTDPGSHGGNGDKGETKRVTWNTRPNDPRFTKTHTRKLTRGGIRNTAEYEEVFNNYLADGISSPIVMGASKDVQNALQSDDEQRGGYFVPSEEFIEGILRNVDDEVFVQRYARVLTLRQARSTGIRKRVAKANAFAWGAELTDISKTFDTSLAFGKRVLTPHYATAGIQISRDLMRSGVEDPQSLVMYEIGINAREFLEQAFLLADGNEKPLGLLVASPEGISTSRDSATPSGATSTFTFDDLIAAKYTLKPQYRSKAIWMLHRQRVADIASFKAHNAADTAGSYDYLWQPSRIVGEPDRIMGSEFIESEWMPSSKGAGLYYALYGDFSYYYIVYALDMEIMRLNEIAARTNQVEYHFRVKVDAMPVLEEAFTRCKFAAS